MMMELNSKLSRKSVQGYIASRRTLVPAAPYKFRGSQSRSPLIVRALLSTTSSNPAFTYGKVQESIYEGGSGGRNGEVMTVDGAVQKTTFLLGVTVLAAAYTWMQIFSGNAMAARNALSISKMAGIAGLGTAMATLFKPHWAPTTAPLYALTQGLAVGALSAVFELRYPGIVLNAAMLTFGVAGTLLLGFQSRLLNVTEGFRSAISMVTGGYMFAMLGIWLMSLLGVHLPGLFSGGPLGMGLCLLSAGLASSNLLLDFEMIRSTARQRMPKWFEWYSSFSLMVTLVWCYTEILRLLGMFARRDD